MSIAEIEARFRLGSITKSDCDALKKVIMDCGDESELESAIYIYGRCCGLDDDVLKVCMKYLVAEPTPGLTAACMQTVLDYWNLWEKYPDVLTKYLNIDLYDDWYDEVLFACRFCSSLSVEQPTATFVPQLRSLVDAARREGISDLLELAR